MKRRNYIRPAGKSIHARFRRWVIEAVSLCVIAVFFAVLFIEWMAGCGESYVDAKGQRHQYECVFLTLHKE